MPLFNVETRRIIEGEIEIEADNADDAEDQVKNLNNTEFMIKIDILMDEIEVTNVENIDIDDNVE